MAKTGIVERVLTETERSRVATNVTLTLMNCPKLASSEWCLILRDYRLQGKTIHETTRIDLLV
jgi:hypothetical protein